VKLLGFLAPRRRKSSVIDAVGDDARDLSAHLARISAQPRLEQPRRLGFGRQSPLRRELVDSVG
jgi:hypothetical protein